MHIKIKRGLDIPIEGEAKGEVQSLAPTDRIALDLSSYGKIRWKLLVKEGERVAAGAPLIYDKNQDKLLITSPAGGQIIEIRKGEKMRLLSIIIERDKEESFFEHPPLKPSEVTLDELAKRGLLAHIRARPFGQIAKPERAPSAIFVQAIESAPFLPPPEMQVEGMEESFQDGLCALSQIANVHLVCRKGKLEEVPFVTRHTAYGPHPIATPSLHIQKISPIRSREDLIWTLKAWDVVAIGKMLKTGRPHLERVCSVAGMGFSPDMRKWVSLRVGSSLAPFSPLPFSRLLSGDPLNGKEADFLAQGHDAITALPEEKGRQFFHFLRPGFSRYSFHRTYPFPRKRPYNFSVRLHGEARSFVDGSVYDKVMPLSVPTMPLIKAVMAEDWEKAEEYGFLEVVPEDFALPTFICPSKIEMVEALENGIDRYLNT